MPENNKNPTVKNDTTPISSPLMCCIEYIPHMNDDRPTNNIENVFALCCM